MTQPKNDAAHSRLREIVSKYPDGLGMQELAREYTAAAPEPVSERTLLRRLAEMQRLGILLKSGRTRAAKWSMAKSTAGITPASASNDVIPLSTSGARVQALVRAPIISRQPVGYEEQFLDSYEPGVTWYLPDTLRAHLHELGRTPDASRPAGTFARDIYQRLLIDLAWASSKLEGNTYTRLDTQNLLDHGIRADGKDADEAQMLLNHKKAIAFLVEQAEDIQFNRYTMMNLHAALSENLLSNAQDEGRLRTNVVGVTGTVFVPLSIPQKIEEHFDVILAKATDIPDPFEQSFFMMVHLPYLQPFADVNKRTSRLAANISLIKQNLCPLSFVDVPERAYVESILAVYELNRVDLLRDVYAWAYERSCAQYRVVRDSVIQPDPIRLRFREQLIEIVHDFVVNGRPPVRSDLSRWTEQRDIPAAFHDAFVETALGLLLALHEGATYRYRVRPSEFRSWKLKITASAAN